MGLDRTWIKDVFKIEPLLVNNYGNLDECAQNAANFFTKLWNFLKLVIRLRLGSDSSKHPIAFERRPTSTPEQITLIGNVVCLFMWDSLYLKLQFRDSTLDREPSWFFWGKKTNTKSTKKLSVHCSKQGFIFKIPLA